MCDVREANLLSIFSALHGQAGRWERSCPRGAIPWIAVLPPDGRIYARAYLRNVLQQGNTEAVGSELMQVKGMLVLHPGLADRLVISESCVKVKAPGWIGLAPKKSGT